MKKRSWPATIFIALLFAAIAPAVHSQIQVELLGIDEKLAAEIVPELTIGRQQAEGSLTEARMKSLFRRAREELEDSLKARGFYKAWIEGSVSQDEEWTVKFEVDPGPPTVVTGIEKELTGEGATWSVLILGVGALLCGASRGNTSMLPLAVSAIVFFVQFVLIGAGKPAEYGRFGVFTNTALAIGAACLLARRWGRLPKAFSGIVSAMLVLCTALYGGAYLCNISADAGDDNSRLRLAGSVARHENEAANEGKKLLIGVLADPAPYGCPPVDFSRVDVVLLSDPGQLKQHYSDRRRVLLHPIERIDAKTSSWLPRLFYGRSDARVPLLETPISWAQKPFNIEWLDQL